MPKSKVLLFSKNLFKFQFPQTKIAGRYLMIPQTHNWLLSTCSERITNNNIIEILNMNSYFKGVDVRKRSDFTKNTIATISVNSKLELYCKSEDASAIIDGHKFHINYLNGRFYIVQSFTGFYTKEEYHWSYSCNLTRSFVENLLSDITKNGFTKNTALNLTGIDFSNIQHPRNVEILYLVNSECSKTKNDLVLQNIERNKNISNKDRKFRFSV